MVGIDPGMTRTERAEILTSGTGVDLSAAQPMAVTAKAMGWLATHDDPLAYVRGSSPGGPRDRGPTQVARPLGLHHCRWRVQHVALSRLIGNRTYAASGPIAARSIIPSAQPEKASEHAHVRRREAIPCRPLEPDTSPL